MNEGAVFSDKLSVGYSGRTVVEDISFCLKRGSILSIIGPNGSGKSTLLKTLAGYLKKTGGSFQICGREHSEIKSRELSRLLSVVLTERISPELMTCREVVESGRYPYTGSFGFLSENDRITVDKAIETVMAQDYEDKSFLAVSDGQRQRILLARAVCQEPEIMILDEPTSFLDIHHKIIFLEIVRRLACENNIAVIMSMHELDFAEKISDTVICIKDGRVFRSGKPSDIFTKENITELYDISSEDYDKYF